MSTPALADNRLERLHTIIDQNIMQYLERQKDSQPPKRGLTQGRRAGQKRQACQQRQQHMTRLNPIDQCVRCKQDRIVDKDLAQSSCPRCGETRVFASHIFEERETVSCLRSSVKAQEDIGVPSQQLTRARNASAQFDTTFPQTPATVLESVVQRYRRIHTNDTLRAKTSTTAHFLRTSKRVDPAFRRAADRITREVKGEAVQVYSAQHLNDILQQELKSKKRVESLQRSCLRVLLSNGKRRRVDAPAS